MKDLSGLSLNIGTLQSGFGSAAFTPVDVVHEVYRRIRASENNPIWICLVTEEVALAAAKALPASPKTSLFGIPFAVKDNMDVGDLPTTAACPGFSYVAPQNAAVIQRLLDAGAILIGKTNMDQFATGLVGTRSPYGICSSVFNPDYISGGSSSGSAVAVARGVVSFSLGTDTAGSGRVPAAFNQRVGLKPTRGWIGTHGLLPACRTLDCVSIFAETCADVARVFKVSRGFDAADDYSRIPAPGEGAAPWSVAGSASAFRFGVPTEESLEFFGDEAAQEKFGGAVGALRALGGEAIRFDYEPFRKAASLLYSGPWVAERLAALKDFVQEHPGDL